MRILSAAALAMACASAGRAETFTIPVDTANSSVTITLTLLTGSATDSSPVAGHLTLKLDTVASPVQATLYDFDYRLTRTITLNINYGFPIFGSFNSTLANYRIYYATPGVPTGPVMIGGGGAYTFLDVPALQEGLLNYNATGGLCVIFQNNMIPCTASADLSQQPQTTLSEFGGTLTVVGRVVSVVSTFDQTSPLDPNNPALGSIRVRGTIRGSTTVPVIPGDGNGDCVVDFGDITAVLANYGQTGAPGRPGDANNNGIVDFGDITAVLANWGATCG